VSDAELERIRDAYRERDAAETTPYRWDNPGFVAYMQIVEGALLRGLRDAGVRLKGARVLDVGTGTGYLLHRLQECGAADAHGIDLMEERVAEGRKRYSTLNLRAGSATALPYGDGEFDLVTQFTCLSSILHDDVRVAVAGEMQRVARGWVLSFDLRGLLPTALRRPDDSTPIVRLDRPELRRLFGEPILLRRTGVPIELAQLTFGSSKLASLLASIPFLRSHLLGLWRVSTRPANQPRS
jgi:SAM-dependent methyltransferase